MIRRTHRGTCSLQILSGHSPLGVPTQAAIWADKHLSGDRVAFQLPLKPCGDRDGKGTAVRFAISTWVMPDILVDEDRRQVRDGIEVALRSGVCQIRGTS